MVNTSNIPTKIWLIYFFNPFLSLILSLKNYDKKWFKNILWLYIIFFGFTISFVETMDAFGYKYLFELAIWDYRDFNSIIEVFDSNKTNQIDFMRPLINFILTRITTNYHIMFAVYGFIYGYFYSRNIDFIIRHANIKNIYFIGYLLFAAFLVGIWQINGFRFWVATHIFTYGIIVLYEQKNRFRSYLFFLLSLSFHFSFIFPLFVIISFKIIPRWNKVYLLLIVVSLFIRPFTDLNVVNEIGNEFAYNQTTERKVEIYTSEESIERVEAFEKRSFIKIILGSLTSYLILYFAYSIIIKVKNLRFDFRSYIFSFGLVLTLIGSALSFIPSVGRFMSVGLFIVLLSSISIYYSSIDLAKSNTFLNSLGFFGAILILSSATFIFFTFSFHSIFGNYFSASLDQREIFYSLGNFIQDIF